MTKITNYRINTHYTALKQLPETYRGSAKVSARVLPGHSLGIVLGMINISVPAGIYVETPLLRCTLDGNKNHLAPEAMYNIDDKAQVFVSLSQTSNNVYQVKIVASSFIDSSVNIPAFDLTAILKLALAPFSQ